jgi:G:T-mismatch repair DNA endonuclease (very short patch repair protein)
MRLLHMEQTLVVVIKHARNGREYRLPQLPHFSVDRYCTETNTTNEFFGCYWQGCACQSFFDVITTNGDSLVASFEQTMARLEEVTRAVYRVKVRWECEFNDAGTGSYQSRNDLTFRVEVSCFRFWQQFCPRLLVPLQPSNTGHVT